MAFIVPNFELIDTQSRLLDHKFLLDTRLGNPNGVLKYSDGVRHAVSMLAKFSDRKIFMAITQILALSEIQRGGIDRIRPIGLQDIADLSIQQRELN